MVSLTPAMSPGKKEKIEPNHVPRNKNFNHSNSSKSEWGVESILTGMGFEEECVELFVNKAIDTDTFVILEEDDLIEIGVKDASVRARIMEGVRNCQLRKVSQNQLHKQFSVVDGTRILVSCANQLDTLCNLLKYTRQRLNRKPIINQYLYGQYSASEGARDITLALLSRIEGLNMELQELQQMTRQECVALKMHQIGASPLPQEQGFNALVLCGVQRHLIKSCVEAVGQNKRKKV